MGRQVQLPNMTLAVTAGVETKDAHCQFPIDQDRTVVPDLTASAVGVRTGIKAYRARLAEQSLIGGCPRGNRFV